MQHQKRDQSGCIIIKMCLRKEMLLCTAPCLGDDAERICNSVERSDTSGRVGKLQVQDPIPDGYSRETGFVNSSFRKHSSWAHMTGSRRALKPQSNPSTARTNVDLSRNSHFLPILQLSSGYTSLKRLPVEPEPPLTGTHLPFLLSPLLFLGGVCVWW